MERPEIRGPEGRVGVLLPGMGAVATTFIAGVEAVRQGLAKPIGSLTQMNTIRLGKRTEGRSPLIKDFLPSGRPGPTGVRGLGSHSRRCLQECGDSRGAGTDPPGSHPGFPQRHQTHAGGF